MRNVLYEKDFYAYMQPASRKRLAEIRGIVSAAGGVKPLMHLGGDMWAFMPWLGTYAFLAAERFLKLKCAPILNLSGFESARPYFMQFKMKATADEFWRVTRELALEEFDPMTLLYPNEVPYFDKYDEYVPDELIRKCFAYDVLDIDQMRAFFSQGPAGFLS